MRYKGTYRPTYVLGEYLSLNNSRHHIDCVDPETYTWDPLDSDFLTRLSLRPYVSMSRERRLNIPPTALPMLSNLEEAEPESVDVYRRFYSPDPSQNVASSLDLPDYMDAQDPERHRNASSIFEAKTPGALTPWKVMREIPLGQWRLKLRMQRRIVRLEVRKSLIWIGQGNCAYRVDRIWSVGNRTIWRIRTLSKELLLSWQHCSGRSWWNRLCFRSEPPSFDAQPSLTWGTMLTEHKETGQYLLGWRTSLICTWFALRQKQALIILQLQQGLRAISSNTKTRCIIRIFNKIAASHEDYGCFLPSSGSVSHSMKFSLEFKTGPYQPYAFPFEAMVQNRIKLHRCLFRPLLCIILIKHTKWTKTPGRMRP